MFVPPPMKCPRCNAVMQARATDGQLACIVCGHTAALRFDQASGTFVAAHTEPPAGTRIVFDRAAPDRITIAIPGQARGPWLVSGLLGLALMAAITAFGEPTDFLSTVWLSVLLWASFGTMFIKGLFNRFGKTVVRVGTERFTIAKSLWGFGWRRSGRTAEIEAVDIVHREKTMKDEHGNEIGPEELIEIRTKWRFYGFGLSLSLPERLWVRRELCACLRDIGRPVD